VDRLQALITVSKTSIYRGKAKAAAFKPLNEVGDPFSQTLEVTIEADAGSL
jgi:hypothetical protein